MFENAHTHTHTHSHTLHQPRQHITLCSKRISSLAGANYPDTVHRLLVLNAPRFFGFIFRLVRPFIDPVTAAKVVMLGSVEELFEHVPRAAIPKAMGGSCCSGGSDHCAPCIGPP